MTPETENIVEPVIYQFKNRLDYNTWMYCEGCPNPVYRGKLHGILFFSIPIGWYFIVEQCQTLTGKLIFSFYMLCNLFSYGASYYYHVYSHKYGYEAENFAIKLDRAAIFCNVSGNFTPLSIIFLKTTGIYLLSAQWLASLVCIYQIFFLNRTIWWQPLMVGAIALAFIPEMWELMTPYEFWMTMSSYVASVIGGVFYGLKLDISSKPELWGSHENFHLFVVIACVIVYCINFSLASRSENIAWTFH